MYICIYTYVVFKCKQHPTRQWHRGKGISERNQGAMSWLVFVTLDATKQSQANWSRRDDM